MPLRVQICHHSVPQMPGNRGLSFRPRLDGVPEGTLTTSLPPGFDGAVIAGPGWSRRVISTLHGVGLPQGVRPMQMGFEFPEEEFLLPPGGVESGQPGGRMLRRIPVAVQCAPRSGGTALRFMLNPARSQGRPHFIRPTLGWRAQSLWDRAPRTLDSFWMDALAVAAAAVASPAAAASIEYTNGVRPSSPGLRAPRFYRLKRFPYYLFYRISSPALVSIVAVMHHRRHPQSENRPRLPRLHPQQRQLRAPGKTFQGLHGARS